MTSSQGATSLDIDGENSHDESFSSIVKLFRDQANLGKKPRYCDFKDKPVWVGVITLWMYEIIQCLGNTMYNEEQQQLLINKLFEYFVLNQDAIEVEWKEDDAHKSIVKVTLPCIHDINPQEFIAMMDIRLVFLFVFFCSDFFPNNGTQKIIDNITTETEESQKSVMTDKEDITSESDGSRCDYSNNRKEASPKGGIDLSFSSHSPELSAILKKLYSIYNDPSIGLMNVEAKNHHQSAGTVNVVLLNPALHFQAVNNLNMPSVHAFPTVVATRSPNAAKLFLCLLRIVGKSYLIAAQQSSESSFAVRLQDSNRFCHFLGHCYLVADAGSDLEWTLLEILQDCISNSMTFGGFRANPGMLVAMLCRTIESNLGKRRFVALDILRHYCSDPFILETLYEESLQCAEDSEEVENHDKNGQENLEDDISHRNFLSVLLDIIRQAEIFAKYRAWKILAVIATLRIKWLEKYSDEVMKAVELALGRDLLQQCSGGGNQISSCEEEHHYTAEDDADDYLHELPDLKQKMKKEIISLLVNIQMSDWFQRFVHYHDVLLSKVVQVLRDKDSDTCSAASLWLFNCLRVTAYDASSTSTDENDVGVIGKGLNKQHRGSVCSEVQLSKLKHYFDHKTKGNNPASFYSVSFPLLFQLSDELQRIHYFNQQQSDSKTLESSTGIIKSSLLLSGGAIEYFERYRNYLFIISQKLSMTNIVPSSTTPAVDSKAVSSNGIFASNMNFLNPSLTSSSPPMNNNAQINDEKERKNAIRALCKMRLLQHSIWTIELFFDEDFALVESTLDAFQLLMNKTDPLNLLVLHGVCTLLMDILLVIENQSMFGHIVEDKFLISRLSLCGLINLLLSALSIVTFPPIVQLLLGMIGKLLKLESFREHLLLQGCQKVMKEMSSKVIKASILRDINDKKVLSCDYTDHHSRNTSNKKTAGDDDEIEYQELLSQAKRWDYNNQMMNLWTVVHILVCAEEEGSLPLTPLTINKQNQLIDKLEYLANNFTQMPTLLEHELLLTLQACDLLVSAPASTSAAVPEGIAVSTSSNSVYLTLMKSNCHIFARIMEDLMQGFSCSNSSSGTVLYCTVNNILLTNTIKKSLILVVKIMSKIWDNDVLVPNKVWKGVWSNILQKLPLIARRYYTRTDKNSNTMIVESNEYHDLMRYSVILSTHLTSNS